MEDVENNLVALRTDRSKQVRYDRAALIAQDQFNVAQSQYRNGLADFLNVLDSEATLLNARQDAIRARRQLGIDTAALYKAIGGGWEVGS